MHSLAFCPYHGVFQARSIRSGSDTKRAALLGLTSACPRCRTASEIIPGDYSVYGERLNVLLDPTISLDALMALNTIVLRLQTGELTAELAEGEARAAAESFGGLLNFRTWPPGTRAMVIAALVTAVGSIIAARSAPRDVIHPVTEPVSAVPKKRSQKRAPSPKPRSKRKPRQPKPSG
jgi:hypothetical protein